MGMGMMRGREDEFDPCVGQEQCDDCPRFLDDCDGMEVNENADAL